ncbi:MAG: SAM-dependent methyltransferase [Myxococcota bacterium]
MSSAGHFPLYFPQEAGRPFQSEDLYRRLARTAGWTKKSRVLELCGGEAGQFYARELGCSIAAVDVDGGAVEALTALPFQSGELDGVVCLGRVPMSLATAVPALRRFLAPRGRLALTYPVKVGKLPAKRAVDFWEEKRLGEKLLSPREALQVFERAGYEPEGCETLSDAELDAFYRELEPLLEQASMQAALLREELEVHRSQGGKASVTFGLVIGRRKEPGERPPPSRDTG